MKVRKPDTSFIRLDRLSFAEATQEGHMRIAPDLAVEIVSPHDHYYDVDGKALDFLQAGVKVVWVINPDTRTARIHRPDGTSIAIREQDELTAEEVLPGFHCRLGDLFQPPTRDA